MCCLSNSIKQHKCSLLGVLTIHESNNPFPGTRQQFRMMCVKIIYNFSLKI